MQAQEIVDLVEQALLRLAGHGRRRASAAFPATPHRCRTGAELLPAIAQAERAFEALLRRHLDHALHYLEGQAK